MTLQQLAPHDASVGRYFDRAAAEFDTFYDGQRRPLMRWLDQTFRRDMFERFRLTFNAIEPVAGGTILDVGCGSGPYLAEGLRRGAGHVTGIDMADGMIDLARQRIESLETTNRCTLITGVCPDDLPQEQFDYAIVMGVMDYVPNPVTFLSALAERVTDRTVVSFPSTHWFRTPLRKVRYKTKQCPVYFYDAHRIEQVMTDAGFQSVRVEKIDGAGMDFVAVGHCRPLGVEASE
jgi:2-polyprenyl-3-methyl-5-hydroxy-6-metoxy-1,4-benzoquinol methylase